MMIHLTFQEATEVGGYSEISSMHGLHPIRLVDDTYVLPLGVLDDPFHAEHHDYLASLPQIEDPPPEAYWKPEGAQPEPYSS
jgi:hypothetical protein